MRHHNPAGPRRAVAARGVLWILGGEVVANSLRVVSFAVDPIFYNDIYPFPIGRVLISVSAPIGLITTVLLAFAWHAMVSGSGAKIQGGPSSSGKKATPGSKWAA